MHHQSAKVMNFTPCDMFKKHSGKTEMLSVTSVTGLENITPLVYYSTYELLNQLPATIRNIQKIVHNKWMIIVRFFIVMYEWLQLIVSNYYL